MELRTVDDSLADAHYRALRLPAVLLAEYRDGDLRCVTPHHDGDAVRTVTDRLGELAAGEPTSYEPLRRMTPLPPMSTIESGPADTDTDEVDGENSPLLQQR